MLAICVRDAVPRAPGKPPRPAGYSRARRTIARCRGFPGFSIGCSLAHPRFSTGPCRVSHSFPRAPADAFRRISTASAAIGPGVLTGSARRRGKFLQVRSNTTRRRERPTVSTSITAAVFGAAPSRRDVELVDGEPDTAIPRVSVNARPSMTATSAPSTSRASTSRAAGENAFFGRRFAVRPYVARDERASLAIALTMLEYRGYNRACTAPRGLRS